jgi:hypothetical protein
MKTMSKNTALISPDESLNDSSVVLGALILNKLKTKERLLIFDLYPYIKSKNDSFNYENTMSALIFLFMNNIIDFDPPYIYNLAIIKKIK